MPSSGAYQFRISLTVNDQEDGQAGDPVFRDSWDERYTTSRNGAAGNKGGGNPGTVTVPITDTVISFGSMTRPGHLLVKNLDPTNSVDWGCHATALAGAEAGEIFPGQTDKISIKQGVTFRMRANTAPVKVQITAYEF